MSFNMKLLILSRTVSTISRIVFVVKDSSHFQDEDEYLSTDVHAAGSSSKCTEWNRDGDRDGDRDGNGANSGKISGFS